MNEMAIKSIEIRNILSFDSVVINDINEINCIVGKNNVGKSNLLKVIRFFYDRLDGKKLIGLELNNSYTPYGCIKISYDLSRIKKIVTSKNSNKSSYFKHIYNVFFKGELTGDARVFSDEPSEPSCIFSLELIINKDGMSKWSIDNKDKLKVISYLYPFFDIETRHINLYDWNKLWIIVSQLKSFNMSSFNKDKLVEFINEEISPTSDGYKKYLSEIQNVIDTFKYSYKEKILGLIKVGLNGHRFSIDGNILEKQSDGTNSFRYISTFLTLIISLTRREFITPFIFIDEPEIGLHPKITEELIYNIFEVVIKYQKNSLYNIGKYNTPLPKIMFSTHSPNIVKSIMKLFSNNNSIFHFSKNGGDEITKIRKLKTDYRDERFLNAFSDNEARLLFSDFIFFVEGATEIELFGNRKLQRYFPKLRKIDFYSGDNVLIENISPSYTKAVTPYLFLFDMDKAMDVVNGNNKFNKIELKGNGNIFTFKNINKEIENKKYSYSKKHNEIFCLFKKIVSYNGWNIKISKKTLSTIDGSYSEFLELKKNIHNYLIEKNVYILDNTIEGVLICRQSSEIFFKWLESKGVPINDLINKLNNRNYLTKDLLLIYIRLVFGGKSEILQKSNNISKSNKIYKYVNDNLIGNRVSSKKTSGWVNDFLTYAIDHIENNCEENHFYNHFSRYFPQLSDIINKLRF
ncbi:AAA family ATPase [Proteus mirabilis]|nr:AAA family ATPase [Proteus mirabilis]HEK0526395.1 retron Eco8 family effector endonuclease [Proteus mirabilis]